MADQPDESMHEDDLPRYLLSPLEQMAIVTHETYVSFVQAGFSRREALALTMKTMEISAYGDYAEEYEELDLDEDD
jgi:hypothetical protein